MPRKAIDITEKRYGKLVVLERYGYTKNKRITWLCQCDCGNTTVVVGYNLTAGKTRSCGCMSGKKFDSNGIKRHMVNTYDLQSKEYGIGKTSSGAEFYFDKEDYDKIKDMNWHLSSCGYIKTSTPFMLMHRLVMGEIPPNMCVDHINHNKVDNRKCNLRVVSNKENQQNKIQRTNSGRVGVSWHRNKNLWFAHICLNGKLKHLGAFSKKDDAIKAREEAEVLYFGEYRFNPEAWSSL